MAHNLIEDLFSEDTARQVRVFFAIVFCMFAAATAVRAAPARRVLIVYSAREAATLDAARALEARIKARDPAAEVTLLDVDVASGTGRVRCREPTVRPQRVPLSGKP